MIITKAYIDGGRIGRGRKITVIDSENPVFSWAIKDNIQSNRQNTCRLVVRDKGTVYFDSGVLKTDRQSVEYNGAQLPHGVILTLEIVATDAVGRSTPVYSAQFVNGLLDNNEICGEWITAENKTNGEVLYFSKDIAFAGTAKSACLYVAGLGYHSAKLNGKAVTDAKLEPAFSNYRKRIYYSVYPDVADLLKEGDNSISISVAEGWRNNFTKIFEEYFEKYPLDFAGKSVLWAMLKVKFADGRTEVFATDESWNVRFGEIEYASIFNGEVYNAERSRLPFLNTVKADAPEGKMYPMALEPIRANREYEPIEITTPKEGMYVVDFGQNIAGVTRLRLPKKLEKGQKVQLRFSEELDEDGTLYTVTLREAKATDTYIAAGNGRDLQCWIPEFTFHGFRYCEVTGIDNLQKDDITAILWSTDLKNDSFFRCGSALVNAIQQCVVMTETDNMHSILSDCPQRDERLGWMNDATVRFEETPFNFDIGRMFPKIVRDIVAEQRSEGEITSTCPYYIADMPADPVCSAFLVAGNEALMHTGNNKIIEEAFDNFAKWEEFLLSRSDDYIVNYSHYGDWAAPCYACEGGHEDSTINEYTPGILMSTGYSYYNCKLLAKFARLLEKNEEVVYYEGEAEKIRSAFLNKWFDKDTLTIANGAEGAHAFALWLGIVPEEYCQAIADHMANDLIARNYRFTTGNLCTRYLFDMLAKYGHIDTAWELLHREEYPSFGFMLQNEATTVWERFELKKSGGMNSHNHPMYGAVGSFFYQWIMGIKPTSPGFDTVRIAPVFPSKLNFAHCVVDTVRGDLSVRWSKRYSKLYMFVQLPFGVSAEVIFGGKTYNIESGYHILETDI